jgi:hypothetical protein
MNVPFPAEVEKKKVESLGIIAFILIPRQNYFKRHIETENNSFEFIEYSLKCEDT